MSLWQNFKAKQFYLELIQSTKRTDIVLGSTEAVNILNQTISIIVLAIRSDDQAIFTLASSPQKYSEYFPI
jgi:hypothetical protein